MEGYGKHSSIGQSFRMGVIGLGEGKGLVKGLRGHPELTVGAVCDANAELAERVARDYGVPGWYMTLDEMLSREDIDIIAIYTPDQMHIEHIEACFRAGKHVICTKPLVNSLEEAEQVIRLTRAHPNTKLMVGQSSRFFGPMQKQREAYESGKLGELQFVETKYVHDMRWFYNHRTWAKRGGFDLLFACCSHPVDLLRWYMGNPVEVFAYASRTDLAESAGFEGNDVFIVNLKFANGKIGRVLGFYGLEQPHHSQPWIEVSTYGTKGTFIAKYPQLEAVMKYEGEQERQESYFEDIYHYFQFEGINHHAGEFVNYTEYFARSLAEGTKALPDAEDGYHTIAALEAIRKSIRTGQPVVPKVMT